MPTGTEGENLQQNTGTPEGSENTQNQQTPSGEVDYSKIDWTKVDWSKVPADVVPDSVVKATKTGKALLEETINRRKTINQLKEALDEKPAEEPKKQTSTQQQDEVPAWAKPLIEAVSGIQAEKAKSTVNQMVKEVMDAKKLPDNLRPLITGETKEAIEAQVALLANAFVPADGTSPGNPGGMPQGDITSRARTIIQNHLKGSKPVADANGSIFGMDKQRIK